MTFTNVKNFFCCWFYKFVNIIFTFFWDFHIFINMLITHVNKGNIERALKEYKGKVIKTRQMSQLNDRKEFEKESVRKRREKSKGVYKEKKRREE